MSNYEVPKERKKNAAIRFRDDLRRYVREYCEMSSIQGLAYMINTSTIILRIWWVVIFMLGITGSIYMVYEIMDKWITAPVLVSLSTREGSINEIPFPAVTLCPEAKISRKCLNYSTLLIARKKKNFEDFDIEQNIYFDYMAALCRPENHRSTLSLLTSGEVTDDIFEPSSEDDGPSRTDYGEFFSACKSFRLENSFCSWMGKPKNCTDILTPILTDQGLCYSFNMYDVRDIFSDQNSMTYYEEQNIRRQDWNPDKGYTKSIIDIENSYPRRAFLSGTQNALVVVFLTDIEDLNYACQDFSIQGVRVALHTASRIPRLGQIFFSVGLDRLTTVSVDPSVTDTSKRIQSYNPEKRGCFFGYERKLRFFKYYSQANCNFECWANYTISKCGCSAFYMPRDKKTRDCPISKRFCLENARVSYNEDILRERLKKDVETKILRKWLKWILKFFFNMQPQKKNTTTACNCMPLCSDITYNAEIDTSVWNFNDADEADVDNIRESLSGYKASAVKVFFKNRYFLPNQRDELYGTSSMISNIGGALGLFTGFALVSLAEIIYFLSIKLIDNYIRYHHWVAPAPAETR